MFKSVIYVSILHESHTVHCVLYLSLLSCNFSVQFSRKREVPLRVSCSSMSLMPLRQTEAEVEIRVVSWTGALAAL